MRTLPEFSRLIRRWRVERAVVMAGPVLWALAGWLLFVLVLLWIIPVGAGALWVAAGLAMAGICVAVGAVAFASFRPPAGSRLAKRVDRVFGMEDHALVVEELGERESRSEWEPLIRRTVVGRLEPTLIERDWTVPLPSSTRWAGLLAAVIGAGLLAALIFEGMREGQRLAELDAAALDRVAAAEEVLEDWEKFSEATEDEDLKRLFHEAGQLREALEQRDPLEAMQAMNEIESRIQDLEALIAEQSFADRAGSLAEALESFEGMGAMSAALRSQNFSAAANEADNLANRLDPQKKSKMGREEAVAEMLAKEADEAGRRGNTQLSEGLKGLSEAAAEASKSGEAPNAPMCNALPKLAQQFSQEAQRQGQGQLLSLSRRQLEALRQRLREGDQGLGQMPSLCQAAGMDDSPGGKQAGEGSTDPFGDPTELAGAQQIEALAGTIGEGNTEVTTSASAQGSGSTVATASAAEIGEMIDLSRQAVLDESLPLAHRQLIRDYFEKIRPTSDSINFQ